MSRGLQGAQHLSLDVFGELLDDLWRNLCGGAGMVKDVRHRIVDSSRLAMGGLIVVRWRVGRV